MAFGNIAPFMALGPEQLGRTLLQKNVPPANYDPFANIVTVPQKPSNAMPMPYPSTTEARPLFDPFANTTITNSAVNQTPQPSGKQVRLPSGKIVTFPPNVPDDQILRDAMQLDQVDQDVNAFENQHPLAKGLQQLVGPQFGFQPPQPAEYKIPVVPGNTFGMTPQTLNNTLGIIQNTQNSNAAERIRQRVQIEQEMEREKDRAQQLKLEQQRLKNQQMMEKMRMQQEAAMEKEKQGRGTVFSGTGGTPVWAGVDPNTGQPFARAIPVEGADARTKFQPVGTPQTIKDAATGQPALVQLLVDDFGNQKLITIGSTQAEQQEVKLINTVDSNGNPVQAFVPVQAGAAYPTSPQDSTRPLTEYQQIQIEQRKQEQARSNAEQDVLRKGLEEINANQQSELVIPYGEGYILSSKGKALAEQNMRMYGGGNSSNRQSTLTPREDGVLELTFP